MHREGNIRGFGLGFLLKGSDIYLPSQIAGNFDTSGTQSSCAKITPSPGMRFCSILSMFTLKDDVNEMPPLDKAQTDLFGNLNVCTWADFLLHLFISLLSLSTHIMSETA